jgi:N-acetylglucosaminyl-diphospho-decaprenol L-rhamnosyltransferase
MVDNVDRRVQIVVASRNRREVLLGTVARHLALPERPSVVIVDNGSSDDTAAALSDAFAGVQVIRLDRNAGGAGRNIGVQACSAPYIALTDDDAWWQPGALRRAADLLDENPRLALVQPHILVGRDERDDPTCKRMAASPLPAGEGQSGHPLISFVACAALIRREAFLAVGGFHERLAIGGEEELLGWDLLAAGWQLSYVPELAAHHDPPKTSDGRPRRREIQMRNALWTAWLRRPARVVATQAARSLREVPRDRLMARSFGRALLGVPWILKERRPNPPHVEAMLRRVEAQRPAVSFGTSTGRRVP